MPILKLTCTIFMIAGCCRPQSWTSLFKRTVYNIYRLYVISMLYCFTLSQIMDVAMNVDNPNDFINNLNMMLNMSASCYKIFIAWLSYKNIAALINYLTEEPFEPLDSSEMEIRRQYDKIIRNNTLRYTILIVTTCTFMSLMSLLTDFRHKKLTYRGWLPYDYSSYIIFCFTYAQQILSTFHGAVVNVACDTLLCGFLMHICCQIEILEYRLKKFLCNQFSLGYCIRHHNRIFELVIILGAGKSSWRFRSQFFNQKPQKFFTDGIMALLLLSTMFRHFSGRAMMPSVKNFCGFWLKNCDRKRHELFPGPNINGGKLSIIQHCFYVFTQMVNTGFTQIIGFQFIASTMLTCSNLYQLTKSALSTDHATLIMYTICILTQIFIYCWFGNEVKLKSLQLTESVYQMEWSIVDNSVKKDILIIMKRAMIPIEISTIHILTINLDSFVTLLKTSYSAYNVLVHVQE